MSKKKSQFRWNSDQPLQFCGSLQREESANTQHWEINLNLILEALERGRTQNEGGVGPNDWLSGKLALCCQRWTIVEKNLHREHTRQDLPGAMQPNRATFSQSLSLTSSSWVFEDFLQKKIDNQWMTWPPPPSPTPRSLYTSSFSSPSLNNQTVLVLFFSGGMLFAGFFSGLTWGWAALFLTKYQNASSHYYS